MAQSGRRCIVRHQTAMKTAHIKPTWVVVAALSGIPMAGLICSAAFRDMSILWSSLAVLAFAAVAIPVGFVLIGHKSATGKQSPLSFCVRVVVTMVVVPFVLYLAGYFAVMDRHLPTSLYPADAHYFESSCRWATRQASQKGGPPDTPWPNATGWNDLYRPLDRIYFTFFPRSDADNQRLRHLGHNE